MINPNLRLLVPGALILIFTVLAPAALPEAASGALVWLGIVFIGLSLFVAPGGAQPRTRRRTRRKSTASRARAKRSTDRSNVE